MYGRGVALRRGEKYKKENPKQHTFAKCLRSRREKCTGGGIPGFGKHPPTALKKKKGSMTGKTARVRPAGREKGRGKAGLNFGGKKGS